MFVTNNIHLKPAESRGGGGVILKNNGAAVRDEIIVIDIYIV
jgi:hypothetical protein